jgi:molybdopterin converting factor small subunit
MTERTIQLKLYADLRSFAPADGENVPIEPGTTVRELLHRLALPEEKAKLIFINGTQADPSATLQGGERVGIFPPVGGG